MKIVIIQTIKNFNDENIISYKELRAHQQLHTYAYLL